MTTRTSETSVTFKRPFLLSGLDAPLPAGDYQVETEEERLEGLSYPAYRRTATVLRLPARSGPAHLTRALTVDPEEFYAALERDNAGAETAP